MKKIHFFILILIFTSSVSIKIYAQFENHSHRVTTLKMVIPEKGSEKELKSLINNWIEKVGKINSNILNYELTQNDNSKYKMQFVITEEYDNWDFIQTKEKSNKKTDDLLELDYESRKIFQSELSEYISSYNEEVYPIEEIFLK